MPNSRDIDQESWEHARESLVYYFLHRGFNDAEDLANETLLTIWTRADYVFERPEDFLRVCYGFALNIRRQRYRQTQKELMAVSGITTESPGGDTRGLRGAEIAVFLKEVQQTSRDRLREKERGLIEAATSEETPQDGQERDLPAANRFRVGLHRARRKLAKITGWDRS